MEDIFNALNNNWGLKMWKINYFKNKHTDELVIIWENIVLEQKPNRESFSIC